MTRSLILGRVGILARMAAFLVSIAPKLKRMEQALEMPLSQAGIASYLGASHETVCRTLRKLREMQVIKMPQRGQLQILSEDRLKRFAEGADPT